MTQNGDKVVWTALFSRLRLSDAAPPIPLLAAGRRERLSQDHVITRSQGRIRSGATTAEMTKTGTTDGSPSSRTAAREARAERLAAALKANLRRRKAQARDRAAETGQPGKDARTAGNNNQS
jgi:hypothetical protein